MSSSPKTPISGAYQQKLSLMGILPKSLQFIKELREYDMERLFSSAATNWMLSTDEYRLNTSTPIGLIGGSSLLDYRYCFLLLEEDSTITPLDYREIHQMIRELTNGIYALNQTPTVSLEPNYDKTSSCYLPSAYDNTKVGQLFIEVDYMLKALWHGVYLPKDRRSKFLEKWRANFKATSFGVKAEDKKLIPSEFVGIGMIDLMKDPEISAVFPKSTFDTTSSSRTFSVLSDYLSMQMLLGQRSITHHEDLFLINAGWSISSKVVLNNDKADPETLASLNIYLQQQAKIVSRALQVKANMRRNLIMLKLVSFLTTFFVGMRKRMKIPDKDRLLKPYPADECRTETDLPPLMLPPDCTFSFFSNEGPYFHLHGGISIDFDTPSATEADQSIKDAYNTVKSSALNHLDVLLNKEVSFADHHYSVPLQKIGNKRYYTIVIEFETYYPQIPQEPLWIRAYQEELTKLKTKRPINIENSIFEIFKKHFGLKRALKCKNHSYALRLSAQKGLLPAFRYFCRKIPSSRSVSKQDDSGYCLLHHAAMHNRPAIIVLLLQQGLDINVRRHNLTSVGPSALHLAVQCGAFDAAVCLVCNFAQLNGIDNNGWTPIHCAAFYNQVSILEVFLRREREFTEVQTQDNLKSTPLLLAATSGSLPIITTLLRYNADVTGCNLRGHNVIHTAVIHGHTRIVQYFIQLDMKHLPVWNILVDMLKFEDFLAQESALRCMEELVLTNSECWINIYNSGGVTALANLFDSTSKELVALTSSVLCNITENLEVQKLMTDMNVGPSLVRLLSSSVGDIEARVSIIISDLTSNIESNQNIFARQGVIPALIQLLDSEMEEVLLNAINAIRVMCLSSPDNQTEVAKCNGVEPLIDFLNIDSDNNLLESAAAATLAAISLGHFENQIFIVAADAAGPLVNLTLSRNVMLQVKGARAIEALAERNPNNQSIFLKLGAAEALVQLLKNINDNVREQGACALWALAGHTRPQQKIIAETIGISNIIKMLLENKSEKLLLVGCLSAIGLVKEDLVHQSNIVKADVLQQLVRLLNGNHLSQQVTMMVVKVLGVMCIGVAYTNNEFVQSKIAEEGAMPVLIRLLHGSSCPEMQVEIVTTLACIVLQNQNNQELLSNEVKFDWNCLLNLLRSPKHDIRLRGGMALTIFSFNNLSHQYAVRKTGAIDYSIYEEFLESSDPYFRSYAAFQVVVLARVIIGRSSVFLTATGVSILVETLQSEDDDVVILAASLLSSLSHTRAGITDAMLTVGALEFLIEKLTSSSNPQLSSAVAVTLGYLTFNPTASRNLFTACRNMPGLYKTLNKNLKENAKINTKFIDDFKTACDIGLPSQCLEINGGFPVIKPNECKRVTHWCVNPSLVRDEAVGSKCGKSNNTRWLRTRSAFPLRQKSPQRSKPLLEKSKTMIEVRTMSKTP